MQIGMIGLGRMGSNLVTRLQRGGHQCVAYDRNEPKIAAVEAEGATGARSIGELVERLDPPRSVWIMLPAAVTGGMVDSLAPLLEPGDIVIDGGNSSYRDDIDRARALAESKLHYVDVGTSGGVFGLDRGFCLMVGGETAVVTQLAPVFATLAPGVGAAPRTPARAAEGEPSAAEAGWLHCGPAGAGHFVKMVHNGIEYGLMAAYAEGLTILHKAGAGRADHRVDAETAPMGNPEHYQYDLDTAAIVELWRRGSVVASWLLDLTAEALAEDPGLVAFGGHVSDSGEGRWTVQAAVDVGAPVPVLASALFARFSSRGEADFGNRVLSAMRQQFGGHAERRPA